MRARRVGLAAAALSMLLPAPPAQAQEKEKPYRFGGHTKYQLVSTTYPDDSLFRQLTGPNATDLNLDARLNFSYRRDGFGFTADYQLIALWGDTIELTRDFPPELRFLFGRVPDDQRRLFDLTHVLTDEGNFAALHRLDRLAVGYSAPRGVVRFGRQAVSWGNGLVYTPMDIFNPFDPAAVDKEFKTGDDMLYGQLLRRNGDDLQTVAVIRRSLESGDVASEESSLALKYHGFAGSGEYDLLVATHFDDLLLGVGGNRSIGGAVWRGDLTVTFGEEETLASLVTSLSYSWVSWGRNISGILEYFYNGFGQRGGDYAPAALADNPELLQRIARGELFTLGRHYLAASTLIEITPLFSLTPSLFANLADPSALLQIATQAELRQNLILLGALNLPGGGDGTEFGGIETVVPDTFLSSGPGIFVQLAWYF